MNIVIYNRKKLYEEVWSESVSVVARRYGISDNALRKHCIKLDIPLPPRGYWSRLRSGSKVKKSPLPKSKGKEQLVVYKQSEQQQNAMKKQSERLKFLSEEQRMSIEKFCAELTVPSELVKPHLLIRDTLKYSKSKNKEDYPHRKNVLNIIVSKEELNRAIIIMNVLIKAFELLGYSVENEFMMTKVIVGKEALKIGIKEHQKRTDHVLTREEEKALQARGRKPYTVFIPPPQYDYEWTGKLTFFIDEYNAKRKNWNDTEKQKIEDSIGEIIISLLETAEELKEIRIRRELQHQKWLEEEERSRRHREAMEKETNKLKALEQRARNYQRANLIREYINALECELIDYVDGKEKKQIMKYITWARDKADWLDPLIEREDRVLGPAYEDEST